MATIKRLCVYCGSSARVAEIYRNAASKLGTMLAHKGIELVYGGGKVGLMGLCADATLAGGGQVTGIIPGHLHDREVGHRDLTRLMVVGSMHERKQLMADMADAFAVLPGGFGTLDEAFEIITWRYLGLHDKPVVIVDIDGYWAKLGGLIDHIVAEGFAARETLRHFEIVPTLDALFETLAAAPEPRIPTRSKLA